MSTIFISVTIENKYGNRVLKTKNSAKTGFVQISIDQTVKSSVCVHEQLH